MGEHPNSTQKKAPRPHLGTEPRTLSLCGDSADSVFKCVAVLTSYFEELLPQMPRYASPRPSPTTAILSSTATVLHTERRSWFTPASEEQRLVIAHRNELMAVASVYVKRRRSDRNLITRSWRGEEQLKGGAEEMALTSSRLRADKAKSEERAAVSSPLCSFQAHGLQDQRASAAHRR